jgi:hypothetical protein
MKKLKNLTKKIEKKNLTKSKKIENNLDKLKFKFNDPNRLNTYW